MHEQIIEQWFREHGITSERAQKGSVISPLEQKVMQGSIKSLNSRRISDILSKNASIETLAKISILDMYFMAQSGVDEAAYAIIEDEEITPNMVCDYICMANGSAVFLLNLPKAAVDVIYKGTFSYLNRIHTDTPNSVGVLFYAALESNIKPGTNLRNHISASKNLYSAIPNSHSIADIYILSIARESQSKPFSQVKSSERVQKASILNKNYAYLQSLIKINDYFMPHPNYE